MSCANSWNIIRLPVFKRCNTFVEIVYLINDAIAIYGVNKRGAMELPLAKGHFSNPSYEGRQKVQPLALYAFFVEVELHLERTRLLPRHTFKQVRRWIGIQVV